MKKIIKSNILIVLMIVCIYQASIMWASELNSSERIFPNSVSQSKSSSFDLLDDEIYLLTPNKLGVLLDPKEKEFTVIKKTSVFYSRLYKESAAIFIESLTNGEVYAENVAVDDLFSSRSLFYTMNKDIAKETLIDVFKLDKDLLKGVDYIKSFGIILPASDDMVLVYLMNQNNNADMYIVNTERSRVLSDSINFYLDQIEQNTNTLTMYDSSLFDSMANFSVHTLLPTNQNKWGYIKDINFYKPFINIDGFIKKDIENYVNGFEPGAKWDYAQDDRIMYGNDMMLITYDSQGVFKYQLFLDKGGENLGLADSFVLVNNFIQKDNLIKKQEFYLKNYRATDNGYVFNYGYGYDGFPIIMDSELLKTYGLEYPLSIEVKGNEVVSYERILIAMDDVIPELKTFNGDYKDMLQRFNDSVNPIMPISDAFLGYYWTEEDTASMKWIIDYNQFYYSIDM